jgi:hypothetical protein
VLQTPEPQLFRVAGYSITSSARSKIDGYRKAKRLGGLEVYDHLEFGRHLNG